MCTPSGKICYIFFYKISSWLTLYIRYIGQVFNYRSVTDCYRITTKFLPLSYPLIIQFNTIYMILDYKPLIITNRNIQVFFYKRGINTLQSSKQELPYTLFPRPYFVRRKNVAIVSIFIRRCAERGRK